MRFEHDLCVAVICCRNGRIQHSVFVRGNRFTIVHALPGCSIRPYIFGTCCTWIGSLKPLAHVATSWAKLPQTPHGLSALGELGSVVSEMHPTSVLMCCLFWGRVDVGKARWHWWPCGGKHCLVGTPSYGDVRFLDVVNVALLRDAIPSACTKSLEHRETTPLIQVYSTPKHVLATLHVSHYAVQGGEAVPALVREDYRPALLMLPMTVLCIPL